MTDTSFGLQVNRRNDYVLEVTVECTEDTLVQAQHTLLTHVADMMRLAKVRIFVVTFVHRRGSLGVDRYTAVVEYDTPIDLDEVESQVARSWRSIGTWGRKLRRALRAWKA